LQVPFNGSADTACINSGGVERGTLEVGAHLSAKRTSPLCDFCRWPMVNKAGKNKAPNILAGLSA